MVISKYYYYVYIYIYIYNMSYNISLQAWLGGPQADPGARPREGGRDHAGRHYIILIYDIKV